MQQPLPSPPRGEIVERIRLLRGSWASRAACNVLVINSRPPECTHGLCNQIFPGDSKLQDGNSTFSCYSTSSELVVSSTSGLAGFSALGSSGQHKSSLSCSHRPCMQASQPDSPLPFLHPHLHRIDFESDLLNFATDCTPAHTLFSRTGVSFPALLHQRRMSNLGNQPHHRHFMAYVYPVGPHIGHAGPLNHGQSRTQSGQRTGSNTQPPHPAGTYMHQPSHSSFYPDAPLREGIPDHPTCPERECLDVLYALGSQPSFPTGFTSSRAQSTGSHHFSGQRVSGPSMPRQISAAGQAIQQTATMNPSLRPFFIENGANAYSESVSPRRPQDLWSSLSIGNQSHYTSDLVGRGQYDRPNQTHGNNRSAASNYRIPPTPTSRGPGHGHRTYTAQEEYLSEAQSVPESDTLRTTIPPLRFSDPHSPNTNVARSQFMPEGWGSSTIQYTPEM